VNAEQTSKREMREATDAASVNSGRPEYAVDPAETARWVLREVIPRPVGLPGDGLRWHPSLLLGLFFSALHESLGLAQEEGKLLQIPEG
jgi:hypothetical protein